MSKSDDLDPLRRLRPDRVEPDDPGDPAVFSRAKERFMSAIDEDHTTATTYETPDVYPRLGPTMEWDVAAGDCVFRQSGRDGERPSPLTYNKPDLRNPSFVIGL